jgi:hypothetical protein
MTDSHSLPSREDASTTDLANLCTHYSLVYDGTAVRFGLCGEHRQRLGRRH